ncbi:MAG TPA: permease [Acidimicrobiales bacterium]|nr:permease [Acidimicrobiales bacterium]
MVDGLLGATVVGAFGDIGRSLREGFFMFWETLWPLVLGFGLSGAVQAFVSREQMERSLGNHRPAAVVRASGFGMVSSSCSYAASAMAKSLFQKGADFTSAMVFMFASTNLVIELGIVLVILMGWQFMAAEFLGGPIMIVMLALLGGLVVRSGMVEAARERLTASAASGHDHAAMSGVSQDRQPWHQKLGSRAAWADAAAYTMADLTMLRKEMAIGYVVAGLLATLVPNWLWNAVFIHGHGVWTSVENALVGPIIAFLSFVCSIGNVPMAAALWKGGIGFGGVISFIFADLIAAPLVLIYRRYYGGALTLRLVGLFWAVMAGAGLIVQGIFSGTDLVPHHRPTQIVSTAFHWNYTSFLNIIFLGVFAGLYRLYRNQERLGGGSGYAIDPICGMQVRTATAPANRTHHGKSYWFCSDHCAERFDANPDRYAGPGGAGHTDTEEMGESPMVTDPVCGMSVDPATAAAVRSYDGRNYFFCAPGCAEAFDADPARYLDAGRRM